MSTNTTVANTNWNLVRAGDDKEIQVELRANTAAEYVFGSTAPSASLIGHTMHPSKPYAWKPPATMDLYIRAAIGSVIILTVAP